MEITKPLVHADDLDHGFIRESGFILFLYCHVHQRPFIVYLVI